jgi:Uma2 family endonuclease
VREALEGAFPAERGHVREEKSLALGEWDEPEPDAAFVVGDKRRYARRHPTAADTLLVVEVAVSTPNYDLGDKADIYAAAGVNDYWIVNLPDRVLEIRQGPTPNGESDTGWRYANRQVHREDETAPLPIPGHDARINVRDLLPAR